MPDDKTLIWAQDDLRAEVLERLIPFDDEDWALALEAQIQVHMWEAHLTPREQEVAWEMLQGLSNEAIAGRLFIEPATVKGHLTHIRKKVVGEDGERHMGRRVAIALVLVGLDLEESRKAE